MPAFIELGDPSKRAKATKYWRENEVLRVGKVAALPLFEACANFGE